MGNTEITAMHKKPPRSPTLTNDHNPTSDLAAEADSGLLEIISRYTQTFTWLQRYDEGMLTEPTGQSGGTLPSETQATAALALLKASLMARGETTALFAQPRGDGLGALLGSLDQTVFSDPAYPTRWKARPPTCCALS